MSTQCALVTGKMGFRWQEKKFRIGFHSTFQKKVNAMIVDMKRHVEDVQKDFLLKVEIT